MRQSRTRIRRKSKGNKFRFIIIFLILLPSISILFGYLGTKYVIKPILFKNSVVTKEKEIPKLEVKPNENIKNINEEPSKKVQSVSQEKAQEAYVNTLEIQGFDIFSIQVGSFSTKANAQALVNELSMKEMGAYIWYNEKYKVMTVSMLDRESLDLFMENIKKQYSEAFVTSANIPMMAIKYDKKDSKYGMLLESQNKKLIELFNDVAQIIKRSKENTIDIEECSSLIKKDIDVLKDMQRKFKEENPSEHMKPMHEKFIKIVNDLTNELENALQDNSKSLIGIQNAFMKGLYQYSDFTANNEY